MPHRTVHSLARPASSSDRDQSGADHRVTTPWALPAGLGAVAQAERGLPPVPLNVVGEITSLVTPPGASAGLWSRRERRGNEGIRGVGSKMRNRSAWADWQLLAPVMWGLVTSATLAHLGHDVCCTDIVPEKVVMLSRGEIPMVELGHPSRNSRIPATSKRSQTTKGVA